MTRCARNSWRWPARAGPRDYDLRLSAARALFAKALETPGGLKIQTIHAFCEKLLRRFPLEAGVSPGFRVMDDAASAAIADAARKAVARLALKGEGRVAEAYARFAVALDFQSFQSMFGAFESARGRLAAYLEKHGGLPGAVADIWGVCGFPEPVDPEAVELRAIAALNLRTWREAAEVLAQGGKADAKNAAALAALASEPTFHGALACLFTDKGEGTPADLGRQDQRPQEPPTPARWRACRPGSPGGGPRLAPRRPGGRGHPGGPDPGQRLPHRLRHGEGVLRRARLRRPDRAEPRPGGRAADAAWVLYKLDGGIDHILVDEAQDTAPEQWDIVRSLAGEFFAGAGVATRHPLARSLFVVGDEKQSIYSFQGAARQRLLDETRRYPQRIRATGAGSDFEGRACWTCPGARRSRCSPSSTRPVRRRSRDAAGRARAAGPGPSSSTSRRDHAGCVDLWPLEREEKGEEREAWDDPLDGVSEASANKRLAAGSPARSRPWSPAATPCSTRTQRNGDPPATATS
jgi:ATP-dependent helicase/nuclease subunit A